MTNEVHATAIDPLRSNQVSIDPSAQIGVGVKIGPWTVIGPNVVIGDHCQIDSHVVICRDTTIGCHNRISSHAVLGSDPQDREYDQEPVTLTMGSHNVIREFCTINRGTVKGGGQTRIGDRNMFLAYSHVAHDCQIGDGVLMVNHATLAGHVRVNDHAILGAFTAVHQHCVIGAYSFLCQATEVSKDIPPYMLVRGIPGTPFALNTEGLKRHGFSSGDLRGIKQAFRLIYRQNMPLDELLRSLSQLSKEHECVERMITAINESQRGIARKACDNIEP